MISIISTDKRTLVLERASRGSIDCLYSASYSKIASQNLATICKAAYWETNEYVTNFIEKTVQFGDRNSEFHYIFRHHQTKEPIPTVSFFEHAPGGLSIIDTQGFSFEDPENIYLVFRGTEPSKIRDWLTDLSATSTPFPYGFGHVHSGFSEAFASVVPDLQRILASADKTKNVVVCGHSLGGAIATLCAAWIRETFSPKVMLYTFGSPRVGCRDFVEHYSKTASFPAFRVANPTDIVPSLPWDTASRDVNSLESLPLVVLGSHNGWLLKFFEDSSESRRYQHFGTPVSLRPPGYTIVDNPSGLDGEFMEGVQQEWERMSVTEFVASRQFNAKHHSMDVYLERLHADFLGDCRNWAFGDPAPFLLRLAKTRAKLLELDTEIDAETMKVYGAHAVAEPDASRTRASRTHEVASADRLKMLTLQRSQLEFQAGTLELQAQQAYADERAASLLRLTQRPMDGYLENELHYHAKRTSSL